MCIVTYNMHVYLYTYIFIDEKVARLYAFFAGEPIWNSAIQGTTHMHIYMYIYELFDAH